MSEKFNLYSEGVNPNRFLKALDKCDGLLNPHSYPIEVIDLSDILKSLATFSVFFLTLYFEGVVWYTFLNFLLNVERELWVNMARFSIESVVSICASTNSLNENSFSEKRLFIIFLIF